MAGEQHTLLDLVLVQIESLQLNTVEILELVYLVVLKVQKLQEVEFVPLLKNGEVFELIGSQIEIH